MVLLIMSFLRTLRDRHYRIIENQASDISLKARECSRFTFPCINLGVHIISEQIPGFSEFAVYHITWMLKLIKPSEILNYHWSLKNINFYSWFFLTSLILVSSWLLFSSKHIYIYKIISVLWRLSSFTHYETLNACNYKLYFPHFTLILLVIVFAFMTYQCFWSLHPFKNRLSTEVLEWSSLIEIVRIALCTILLGQHVLDVYIIIIFFEKFLTGKMWALWEKTNGATRDYCFFAEGYL